MSQIEKSKSHGQFDETGPSDERRLKVNAVRGDIPGYGSSGVEIKDPAHFKTQARSVYSSP